MQVMEVSMRVAVLLPHRPTLADMNERGKLAEAVTAALVAIGMDHGAIVTVDASASVRSRPGKSPPGDPPAVAIPDPGRYKNEDSGGRLPPDALYPIRDAANDLPQQEGDE